MVADAPRARGHEHRHQPRRDRQGHPARQCRSGLHHRRSRRARLRPGDQGHRQGGSSSAQEAARRSRLEARRRRRPREGRRQAAAARSTTRQAGNTPRVAEAIQGYLRRIGVAVAASALGLDHRAGEDGRAGLRDLVGDGALSVGRRPHEHLFRFPQHPDAQPDELEGRRNRRLAEAGPLGADRDRSRQILRAGAAEGDARAPLDARAQHQHGPGGQQEDHRCQAAHDLPEHVLQGAGRDRAQKQ